MCDHVDTTKWKLKKYTLEFENCCDLLPQAKWFTFINGEKIYEHGWNHAHHEGRAYYWLLANHLKKTLCAIFTHVWKCKLHLSIWYYVLFVFGLLFSCSVHPRSSPYPTVLEATMINMLPKWFLHHLAPSLLQHPPPQSISSTVTSGSCASNLRVSPAVPRPWGMSFVHSWWHHCTLYWRKLGRRHWLLARQHWAPCGASVGPVATRPWRSWSTRTQTTCSITYHWTCRGSASIHRYSWYTILILTQLEQ